MTTKKSAFTLAEVLITLGIIGVVAAMTIPTLISNTNSAKFKSQYKKTLSTLNQAAKMAEAKYDLNFASLSSSCTRESNLDNPENYASFCAIMNGTLSGAHYSYEARSIPIPGSTQKYSINRNLTNIYGGGKHTYILADGSIVGYSHNMEEGKCTVEAGGDITALPQHCRGWIDVNGATLPNKEVACSDGTASITSSVGNCIVRNNATDMGDIFPVVFHDSIVEPTTNAARYVLQQAK